MKNLTTKRGLRCAICTRVSTDQGLEQDFNSLDAQREASEAYIKREWPDFRQPIPDRQGDERSVRFSMVHKPKERQRAQRLGHSALTIVHRSIEGGSSDETALSVVRGVRTPAAT
jgi:hypothetical protein